MKIITNLTTAFLLIGVFAEVYALVDTPCRTPQTWSNIQTTQGNLDENSSDKNANGEATNKSLANLILELDENKIKLGKPFSFKVGLCSENNINTVKPDRITANAIMPAHQHGMNYIPKISYNKDSKQYDILGFLFHMPGLWEITISSYHDDKVTHFIKTITIN